MGENKIDSGGATCLHHCKLFTFSQEPKVYLLIVLTLVGCMCICQHIYHSLAKERPWAEHLKSLSKRGVGALSSVFAFNHERALMYAYRDSLPSNSLKYWMKYNIQWSHQPWKLEPCTATQHSKRHKRDACS